MTEYATDLRERQRIASYYKRRYWSDPAWRLKKLNRSRAGFGLPPLESVEQIATRGPLGA